MGKGFERDFDVTFEKEQVLFPSAGLLEPLFGILLQIVAFFTKIPVSQCE